MADGGSSVVMSEAIDFAEECRRVGASLALELANYCVEGLCRGFASGAASEALAVLQLAGQIACAFDKTGHSRVRGKLSEGGTGRLRAGACLRSTVSAGWRRRRMHRRWCRCGCGGLCRRCY
jgi:hypothetical protein